MACRPGNYPRFLRARHEKVQSSRSFFNETIHRQSEFVFPDRHELLTLLWDDVHLDEAYLVVRYNRSNKAKRDDVIPLHPVAVEHLRKITHFGLTVFDWPLEKRALYDQWHNIQREAGIDLPCHEDHTHTPTCHVYGFHSLKKACGTLNAARLPEAALNAFMRHASGETTRKYYQNQERIAGGVVDQMFVPESAKAS